MEQNVNDQVQQEVDDIVDKTRVVPVTMIAAVLIALIVLSVFVFGIYQDTSEGTLRDEQGVVSEQQTGSTP